MFKKFYDKSIELASNKRSNFYLGIVSFVAFIIILDTFKNSLTSIFPNIKIILDNLYQSLHDIKLFMLDLFK